MSDALHNALREGARMLAATGAQARAWVSRVARTASTVANEEQALLETARRAENVARKLAAAADRRNGAGVFGPSQAGKSYLVSVLGRSKDEPLMADFAGSTVNFIQDINPEGGKESTGLVTRFTTVPGTRDTAHPVELRLLTEVDLVKILGNCFLSDFDQHNRRLDLCPPEEAQAVLQQLEARSKTNVAHLDEIAMFDIADYFRTNFSTSVARLSHAGYWEALTRFGHQLDTAGRMELYALLWGRSQDLTATLELLLGMLEQLEHAPGARAAMACLAPRERSIINVETLGRLGTDEGAADMVEVVPEHADGTVGAPLKMARATLAALVAEIKVVMSRRPWPFLQHTDLLDFPGARAREKMVDLPADPSQRAFCVRNMFLRGKIAYLFQRYAEQRELASMLLCMPPSNQEVKDLTSLVGNWVAQTHGDTPEQRRRLPCALFFVLTKFDTELVAKPGDTPESWLNRIDTRLQASMYQLFRQEPWLQDWDGRPFANTFFLRNPGFELEGVFQYAAGITPPGVLRKETGLAAQSAQRLDAHRSGMLGSALCRRHFAQPEQAWDSAMALNDGGVNYLVGELERVLEPALKTRQLIDRLVEQARALEDHLRRFHAAGDDQSLKDKEDALKKLRLHLHGVCSRFGLRKFAELLERLRVAEDDVRAVFLNVASLRLEHDTPVPQDVPAEDPWDDPWAEPVAARAQSNVQVQRRQPDRCDHFATQVLSHWTAQLRGLAGDARFLSGMKMEGPAVSALVDELVIGAHRLGLAERVAERIRAQVATANVRWDEVADRAAGIAAMLLNDYLVYLGYGDCPPGERPAFPEPPKPRVRSIFSPPPLPPSGMLPALADKRVELEREFFVDWGVALVRFGLDNIGFSGGREIDPQDNRALGEILARLEHVHQLGRR